MADGRYHHGDLRRALLDAAVDEIGEKGLAKLSLRECARRVGVSHAAPYRHFADKDALLAALSDLGFDGLMQAAQEAVAAHESPAAQLEAYGAAYVRFAWRHPVLYRVMFTEPQVPLTGTTEESATFQFLVQIVAATGRWSDPLEGALTSWSLVHGLSMLLLDGRIPEALRETEAHVLRLAGGVLRTLQG